ncbi:MAG: DNA replication and repair protein RecF [Pseudomonadota bacterium]
MSINNISIKNFRILKEVDIKFCSDINIFYGLNGSGKTSILECLFFLSRGRSFKQSISNKLISFGCQKFLIFSIIDKEIKIGISKSLNEKLLIKNDNRYITSSFILSQSITLQILSPDSYLLIESGPLIRRKFIDWYVFHVKHNLYKNWKRYKIILKQRNFALKSKLSVNEVKAWDSEFIQLTNEISNVRVDFINYLNIKLSKYQNNYLDNMELFIDYYPGWNQTNNYSKTLQDNYTKDHQYGYTQFGLHKSDFKLKIKIDGKSYLVKDVLSNGVKKYISMFLYILQIDMYLEMIDEDISKPVLLIDDITSEIDNKYSSLLIEFLSKLNIQLFFTLLDNVDNVNLIKSLFNQFTNSEKIKLFHVKHGKINTEINYQDL